MKIVYLCPTGALGGAELCLLDLLASARALGPEWRPHVILGGAGPLEDELRRLDVPCEIAPFPAGFARLGDAGLIGRNRVSKFARLAGGGLLAAAGTLTYADRLARRIAAAEPDLVHSNGMKTHVLAAWRTPRKTPVVWWMHDYLGARPAMAKLLRASRRPRLTVVGVSRSVTEDAEAVLGPRVDARTIHNRIDLERFKPGVGRGDELDRLGNVEPAAPGVVRVGLTATFAVWKGHRVFLEAVARIPRERHARFYVVGGPIYRTGGSQVSLEDLEKTADVLGVRDRIVFTGHMSRPETALGALDVVVHASTRPEPFGRVIVEGMACGRAVVAMRAGGAAELFEDGRTALGCPPNDPAALASSIDRLILDRELRESLGRSGRRAAIERFDRTTLAEEWATIYEAARNQRRI